MPLLFLLYSLTGFSQQGGNIDLEEVVNIAASVPKIEIDNSTYSIRDRDKIITQLLRSKFWSKSFKFAINLEDYDTGRQYNYENKGDVRIFINDQELTERHLFKSYKAIKQVLDNSEKIHIISSSEIQTKTKLITATKDTGQLIYKSNIKEPPLTLINIKSNLPLITKYNGPSKSRRIKTLEDFEVKGKRNIELMKEFNIYEERFMSERNKLDDKRNILVELNEFERVDSIQKLLDALLFKSYLFTANFAINNSDQEIAPYLASKKIPDARIEILESIEKELSDKIKKTRYGKLFQKLLNQRRSIE